jgi:hypothetical protein
MDGQQIRAPEGRRGHREVDGQVGGGRPVHPDHHGPWALRSTCYQNGAAGVRGDLDRDRADQQAGEAAQSAVAEHQRAGVSGLLDKDGRGGAGDHRAGHPYAGVLSGGLADRLFDDPVRARSGPAGTRARTVGP